MLSTTMLSVKLLISFHVMWASKPGYLVSDPNLDWVQVLRKVKSKHVCPECRVMKTASSYHCHVCNKCVDRYEGHCMWTDNCIGRGNLNAYFIFIFYVWLVVFLLGWTSMSSIQVTSCEIDHCIYEPLCFYCNYLPWHYFCTIFDMVVCFFYFVPTSWFCCRQFINYGRGETSHERFGRQAREAKRASAPDERTASFFSTSQLAEKAGEDEPLVNFDKRRGKRGCWGNYGAMCCQRKSLS
jgi:hypothetical protein